MWNSGNYNKAMGPFVKQKATFALQSMIPSGVMGMQRILANAGQASENVNKATSNVSQASDQLPAIADSAHQAVINLGDAGKGLGELGKVGPAAQELNQTLKGPADASANFLNGAGAAAKKYGPYALAGGGGLAALYLLSRLAAKRRGAGGAGKKRSPAAKVTLRHPGDYNIQYNEPEGQDPMPKAAAAPGIPGMPAAPAAPAPMGPPAQRIKDLWKLKEILRYSILRN